MSNQVGSQPKSATLRRRSEYAPNAEGASQAQPISVTLAPTDTVASLEARIALAAYYLAERRGFAPGGELSDWLAAEVEVARATAPSH